MIPVAISSKLLKTYKFKILKMKKHISLLILLIFAFSCGDSKRNYGLKEDTSVLKAELPNSVNSETDKSIHQPEQIATFLTFQESNAEEAMNFYMSLFDNSKIVNLDRWGKEGPGKEGTVMHATFTLNGSLFMCSDSPPIHEWGFTPAVSNFVECKSDEEIQNLYDKLSEGGKVMIPMGNYGWSTKFAYIEDRFGVSWQLNLK